MGSPTIPHTNSSIKSNNMDTHSTQEDFTIDIGIPRRVEPSSNRFTFTHFMASTSTPTLGKFRTQKHKTHCN